MVLTSPVSPRQLLDRFREKVSILHETHPPLKGRQVTLSLGAVYVSDLKEVSIKQLLCDADEALYRAKNKGRNTIECECYDDIDNEGLEPCEDGRAGTESHSKPHHVT